MTLLRGLPRRSIATGISSDGRTIVARVGLTRHRAFRWTEAGGAQELGVLSGPDDSIRPHAVSGDGSVIGGSIRNGEGVSKAFIWDTVRGMRDLRSALEDDFGLDLGGWHLTAVTDISDDGLTLVGTGRNPSGQREVWLASLDRGEVEMPCEVFSPGGEAPVCRCLVEPVLRAMGCRLFLPEFDLVRRIPWPILPGEGFPITWELMPHVDIEMDLNVLETWSHEILDGEPNEGIGARFVGEFLEGETETRKQHLQSSGETGMFDIHSEIVWYGSDQQELERFEVKTLIWIDQED